MAMDKKNAGKRIQFISSSDPYTRLRNGDMGTVRYERDDGFSITVGVDWDSGSSLSLIEGEDRFRIL